jgi:hypothetical protein
MELQRPSTTDTFFTASVSHSHDHEIISDTYALRSFFFGSVVAHKLLICRLLGSSGPAPTSSLLLRGVERLNVLFILK